MSRRFAWKHVGIAGVLWMSAQGASAGLVTLVGNSINFVYDDAQEAIAWLGSPTVIGDSVRFLPAQHRASALNGAVVDPGLADFIFSSVYTRDGTGIRDVRGLVLGDYGIIGDATVGAALTMTVADNKSAQAAADTAQVMGGGSPTALQLYRLSAGVGLESAFSQATNDVSLTINNIVYASSLGIGDGGYIQHKLSLFRVTSTGEPVDPTNPPSELVPSPGVLALFGAGLLALCGVRRRSCIA